tara:strand:- start:3806 stop:4459 length:654 start_codon:yes stop_codon:yes gene_type:complete
MKTIKLITTTLLGFIINVASAGDYSLGTSYVSDYFEEGLRKAGESVQVSLGAEGTLGGLNYSAGAFTNQSINSGTDTYILSGGLSKSFADELISAYVGLEHTEDVAGEAMQEVDLTLSFSTLLSPTVSVLRNLDESLFTYELSLSHSLDVKVASLDLMGSVGNVESSQSVDTDYYTLGAMLSKSVSDNASISVGLVRVDSESTEEDYVTSLGISTRF